MRPLTPARKSKQVESFLRAAFWSGMLPEKKRRCAVRDPAMAHKAILKTSFEHLPVAVLLGELGEKAFVRQWPEMIRGARYRLQIRALKVTILIPS